MALTARASADDYLELAARVDDALARVEQRASEAETVLEVAQLAVTELGPALGLSGGRLYVETDGDYVLWKAFGEASDPGERVRLSVDYLPLRRCLDLGCVHFAPGDPSLDPALESRLGSGEFAAIEVGVGAYVASFDLSDPVPGAPKADVLMSLGLVRRSMDQHIRTQRADSALLKARELQMAITPTETPVFADFDIAGRIDPLERVGGDFYDCIPLTEKILGLAIADVAGHGLAAALQVRDLYMGLRMGTGRDFKIVRTVERLNQIIHLSAGTQRSASMFYGEVEVDGTLIYVNAGHPPPLRVRASGGYDLLRSGGPILGLLPEATYTRGFLTMEPGDVLVGYTDGILEAQGEVGGTEYGLDRLLDRVRSLRARTAEEIVAGLFRDLARFCRSAPPGDDRTVAVVKRNVSS